MKARTLKGSTTAEIEEALGQSMDDGYKPTLAIVFLSVKQDISEVCKVLDEADIAIYGATSNGEFTEAGITSGEIAVLLLDLDPDSFTIYFKEFDGNNFRATTRDIATRASEKYKNPSFLIAGSHLNTDGEALLHGFEDVLGQGANVTGGMAGDDFGFKENSVFTSGHVSNMGIVAIAFDEDKICLRSRATHGWTAVGTEKTVTKSEGNHVYTIDDTPVVDLVIKYGGLQDVNEENFTMEHSTTLPMHLQRVHGESVMRSGLVVDWEDRSFYCNAPVPEGSKIRFSIPPDFDVVEKVIQACAELKSGDIPEADALLLFSCGGRLLSLGPVINEEIEGIQKVWNAPMAGMFCNGEMARATNGNLEYHGLTACCVALKEK